MRDPRRPPAHPLVELVYDLRVAVNRAASDERGLSAHAQVYERLQEALRSARRFVEALEELVDELAAESSRADDERAIEKRADDADVQTIHVR